MERRALELTENDVVAAVCSHLQVRGWKIERRATTLERGFDVVARAPAGALLRVEAKGATSSKSGSARHGRPFGSAQVKTHVARAFFTAAASLGASDDLESGFSAMALPATRLHGHLVDQIRPSLDELRVGVFWVEAPDHVRLEAPWAL